MLTVQVQITCRIVEPKRRPPCSTSLSTTTGGTCPIGQAVTSITRGAAPFDVAKSLPDFKIGRGFLVAADFTASLYQRFEKPKMFSSRGTTSRMVRSRIHRHKGAPSRLSSLKPSARNRSPNRVLRVRRDLGDGIDVEPNVTRDIATADHEVEAAIAETDGAAVIDRMAATRWSHIGVRSRGAPQPAGISARLRQGSAGYVQTRRRYTM